ncbi:peptidase S8/S53 domain-containing protein [Flagelloscypha sp. PMI_526]|nr:peptidase S8/S53 domain-containing protein [Flagelloscypha sp. PMI_526]
MHLRPTLFLCTIFFQLVATSRPAKRNYLDFNYYVLEQPASAAVSLADIAHELNVEIVEQAGALRNHWLVRAPKPPLEKRESSPHDLVLARYHSLQREARTSSASALAGEHSRRKTEAANIISSIRGLTLQVPRQRTKRAPPPIRPGQNQGDDDGAKEEIDEKSAKGVASRMGFQDPLFAEQWHLVNDEYPEHMMNVVPVWEMGITGKGVITSLVDDGLDYTSEDLKDAFDAEDSYDFNDHEDLPYPKLGADHHGTRCAGQIAARTNTACGVGIAYDSKVAGVRILSGEISDVDEAAALNYGYQNVDIYSCSWGPTDDGKTMEAPDQLITKAMVEGIQRGRGGKGSVFVFASGNGAASGDQCNFDGYTNSIYSITVSSIDHEGHHPYYSETCTANMIVAYSSGGRKSITTTDKGENKCTSGHGGTSAAAPNAAGVFALALEARPELTWRDMQYLCITTAHQVNPDEGWEGTAMGKMYSNKYGYGILDGYEYVKAAKEWNLVTPQTWIITDTVRLEDGKMNADEEFSGGTFIPEGGVRSTMTITEQMLKENNFDKLEHIYLKVWIQHTKRGDVEVEVVSPTGIRSVLAEPRSMDIATSGFPGWTFMSVKHWGENPIGDWTVRVWDQNIPTTHNGTFHGWNMILFGASIDPKQVKVWEVPQFDTLLPPGKPDGWVDPEGEKEHDGAATTTDSSSKPTSTETSGNTSESGEPSATSIPAESVGFFSYVGGMITNHPFVTLLVTAIVVINVVLGVFLWRRRTQSKARSGNDEYISLPTDTDAERLPMTNVAGASSSQLSLNHPFRDDTYDDADETTRLHHPGMNDRSVGLGFHDGFLDDEAETPASAQAPARYRDEPEDDNHTPR